MWTFSIWSLEIREEGHQWETHALYHVSRRSFSYWLLLEKHSQKNISLRPNTLRWEANLLVTIYFILFFLVKAFYNFHSLPSAGYSLPYQRPLHSMYYTIHGIVKIYLETLKIHFGGERMWFLSLWSSRKTVPWHNNRHSTWPRRVTPVSVTGKCEDGRILTLVLYPAFS